MEQFNFLNTILKALNEGKVLGKIFGAIFYLFMAISFIVGLVIFGFSVYRIYEGVNYFDGSTLTLMFIAGLVVLFFCIVLGFIAEFHARQMYAQSDTNFVIIPFITELFRFYGEIGLALCIILSLISLSIALGSSDIWYGRSEYDTIFRLLPFGKGLGMASFLYGFGYLIVCYFLAEIISIGADMAIHLRRIYRVQSGNAMATISEQIQNAEKPGICRNCGTQNDLDSSFCVNCGNKIK